MGAEIIIPAIIALAGSAASVSESRKGRKQAKSKVKKETARRDIEQGEIQAEEAEQKRVEEAKNKRDDQRRARLAKRRGGAGREATLIPLKTAAPGGQSTATKELIGV